MPLASFSALSAPSGVETFCSVAPFASLAVNAGGFACPACPARPTCPASRGRAVGEKGQPELRNFFLNSSLPEARA